MLKFKEFDIEIPSVLSELGFEDDSWHNDVSSKATRVLRGGSVIVVWVSDKNRDNREYAESPRFIVEILASEDSFGVPRETIHVADAEEEEELRAVLTKLLECFRE